MVNEGKQLTVKKERAKTVIPSPQKPVSRVFAEIELIETIQCPGSGNIKEEKRMKIERQFQEGISYEEARTKLLLGIETAFEGVVPEAEQGKHKENLSRILKDFRITHDLTMDELAKKVGVTVSSVAKWENGTCTPRMRKLRKLAEVFAIPPQTFYDSEK